MNEWEMGQAPEAVDMKHSKEFDNQRIIMLLQGENKESITFEDYKLKHGDKMERAFGGMEKTDPEFRKKLDKQRRKLLEKGTNFKKKKKKSKRKKKRRSSSGSSSDSDSSREKKRKKKKKKKNKKRKRSESEDGERKKKKRKKKKKEGAFRLSEFLAGT